MTTPTLHLNGTHPDDLREGFIEGFRAVNAAMDTLKNSAAPNGRDYYPQGKSALDQAISEHAARLQRLASVADELLALAVHVDESRPKTGPLRPRQ